MKNSLIQFSLVLTVFIGMAFLMSYTRPAGEEPKEYTIVYSNAVGKTAEEKFGQLVTQKISEGWKCQGGVSLASNYYVQAMVK
jgi:hypothetical protein